MGYGASGLAPEIGGAGLVPEIWGTAPVTGQYDVAGGDGGLWHGSRKTVPFHNSKYNISPIINEYNRRNRFRLRIREVGPYLGRRLNSL